MISSKSSSAATVNTGVGVGAQHIKEAYRRKMFDQPPHMTQATNSRHTLQASSNASSSPDPDEIQTSALVPGDMTEASAPTLKPAPVFQPRGRDIIGHTIDANLAAAADLKATLMKEEHVEEGKKPSLPLIHPYLISEDPDTQKAVLEDLKNASRPQVTVPKPKPNSALTRAFQREYYNPRFRASSQSQYNETPGGASRNSSQRSFRASHSTSSTFVPGRRSRDGSAESRITSSSKREYPEVPDKSQAESFNARKQPSERLRLRGLGEGRSRNEFGKSLQGGQELGVGVIGGAPNGSSDGETLTTVVVTEGGCDIPMIKFDRGSSTMTPFVPHQLSLDPNLPPLAIEHPARVWNSMIHALDPALQPVIKWDYEKLESQIEGDALWVAHLTLVLAPTHPTMAEHPLFRALPKNRYKREYVSAVEALGGVKKWTGEPKKLKADAQNTTLVKSISEDSITWVCAPSGLNVITPSDDEEEEEPSHPLVERDKEDDHKLHRPDPEHTAHKDSPIRPHFNTASIVARNQCAQHGDQQQSALPHEFTNDEEITIDEEERVSPAPSSSLPPVLTPRSGSSNLVSRPPQTPLKRFLDALNRTLGPGGLSIPDPACFTTTGRPLGATNLLGSEWLNHMISPPNQPSFSIGYGSTLRVGTEDNFKIYEEKNIHPTVGEAHNAVCKRALEHNVEGFMIWLQQTLAPTLHDVITERYDQVLSSTEQPPQASQMTAQAQPSTTPNIMLHQRISSSQIDWQAQLLNFCNESGLQQPRFTQKVERLPNGKTVFVGQVTIEEDIFCFPSQHATIKEARQDIARRVFVDHFGQEPR
nr:uncharacterized protein CI109_001766 [Kwoniella shandongensis]KAA5529826.1 hypothetical protein CI109_001766 [Kwoniella shandongensis]